jgi:hypothetical protein
MPAAPFGGLNWQLRQDSDSFSDAQTTDFRRLPTHRCSRFGCRPAPLFRINRFPGMGFIISGSAVGIAPSKLNNMGAKALTVAYRAIS